MNPYLYFLLAFQALLYIIISVSSGVLIMAIVLLVLWVKKRRDRRRLAGKADVEMTEPKEDATSTKTDQSHPAASSGNTTEKERKRESDSE